MAYPNVCFPDTIKFTDAEGASYTYTRGSNGAYTIRGAVSAGTAEYDPDNEQISLIQGTKSYIFGLNGRLLYLGLNNNSFIGFNYDGLNGLLTSVTSSGGQSVLFTWSGGRVTSITDPAGNVWNYAYTPSGMLSSVTAPGSNADIRSYYYEDPNDATLVTGIAINGTRFSTYSYDATKRVTQSVHSDGELADSFTYSGYQTTVTDALGQTTTYDFTPVNGVLQITGQSRSLSSTCPAAASSTVYDGNGWVDYTVDWNGVTTDYNYDASGRMLQVTTAAGTPSQLTTAHQWSGDKIVETNYLNSVGASFQRVVYTYFTSGPGAGTPSSVTVIDPATGSQRVTSFSYGADVSGRVTSRTVTRALPAGSASTTTAYDSLGMVSSVTNALGHVTNYSQYNGLGQPGRVTDVNGVVTDLAYNPNGTLASQVSYVNSGARVVTYAYDHARNVTDIAYSSGRIDRFRYKNFKRVEYVGNAQNEFVQLAYNVPALSTTTSSARHIPTTSGATPVALGAGQFSASTQLDSLGRTRQQSGNAGQQVTFSYDNNGNLKSRSDAGGRTTLYDYDAQNRLNKVTAPDTGITLYGYDSNGRLASVTDPRSHVTQYSYNGFGDVLSVISPDTGTTNYSYDSAGRLATVSKANGVTISHSWDALSRLTARTSAGTTESFTYDEGSYGKGRLTRLNDASGQTTYTYSSGGELIQQVNTIFGAVMPTDWSYDAAGRLTSMTYPTGLILSYGYDAYAAG